MLDAGKVIAIILDGVAFGVLMLAAGGGIIGDV